MRRPKCQSLVNTDVPGNRRGKKDKNLKSTRGDLEPYIPTRKAASRIANSPGSPPRTHIAGSRALLASPTPSIPHVTAISDVAIVRGTFGPQTGGNSALHSGTVTFPRRYIWAPPHLAAVPLGRRYIWPPLHLAAVTFGRRYIWPPLHLAAVTLGPRYTWPPLHLVAVTFGHRYTWPALHLAAVTFGRR